MMADVQDLLDRYWAWLKSNTTVRNLEGWAEITTPQLDRHNDALQIYVQSSGSDYLLSDDGYILSDLATSGCGVDTPKRQKLLETTLNGFGVRNNRGFLEVNASENNFPVRKHNLLQAMLAVNDLFYLAAPHIASLFMEDVEQWLTTTGIRFTSNIKLAGASGFDHLFNFVIPSSREQPERVLNAFTQPNRQNAVGFVFAWMDTRQTRPADARAYAILNDDGQRVNPSVYDALTEYEIEPVRWSDRNSRIPELAA